MKRQEGKVCVADMHHAQIDVHIKWIKLGMSSSWDDYK